VPKPSIGRFLNHSGSDITDHYIRDDALGELWLAEQEKISAHLVKALGSPRELLTAGIDRFPPMQDPDPIA
jgi:hypothetical protein